MPRFDLALFDLDGTLINSLPDITAAGNHAMRTVGRPEITEQQCRFYAGQGLPNFIITALGPDHQDLYDAALAAHLGYYRDHGGTLTRVFPGVDGLLDRLKEAGLKRAILSNKPHAATLGDAERLLGRHAFDAVIGHRDGYEVKPDTRSATEIIERLGVEPDRVAYVGDTAADMLTAKRSGFYAVGVTYGFRERAELEEHGADAIVDDAAGVGDAILGTDR
ncbi:HAD family hydrolase [Phycisphaera mikurensis]|uniref:phosphoglycolate phosphatase n=1 Tax=Phycisphaera mikurensis (strain NBRC 102666 / KCTC 22515 / FYK2301M01) TaxID=1142394 RepID=I0IJ34_PHYMF|nr:HAD family hydrolase [Phycisphaera mikurensis]MBB6443119.1 phosphoglycolate phosphatase [Phycisphaera mikurensis]BAM05272.1 putative hydrolase [Phycisphaera mikurensis NBRC 102666]